MNNEQLTRLTASDLRAIEAQIEFEVSALPPLGATVISWRAKVLGAIASFGSVITLMIVEFIRSFGAIIIALFFAMLEYERVRHGALALGQAESSSVLIAFAIVCANIIHPIYALRAHTRQADIVVMRHTARGILANISNRLFSPSSTRKVDSTHNPTLTASAFIITITTVILAVYDVLGPLITQFAGQVTRPTIILISEFIMGLGLSVGGVLMLQAISHEIALRAFDFDTRSPQEIMADAIRERNAQIADIRERVKASYMSAKIADEARKKASVATITTPPTPNKPEDEPHLVNGGGFLAVNGGNYLRQNGAEGL